MTECPNCLTPWKCNGPHMTDDLPPLPEPYTEQVVEYTGIAVNRVDRFPLYTADQMRAYGDARAAAERERCAKIADQDHYGEWLAAAIRRNDARSV